MLRSRLPSTLPLAFPHFLQRPLLSETVPPLTRLISTTPSLEKRRKGGCSKWKRGGLIQTSIYTGFKGQAPVPKPIFDYKSGDRNMDYDPVPPTTPQSKFKDLDFSSLDPMVRQILSAESGDHSDLVAYHKANLLDKVRRHPADKDSIEVRIVEETFVIKRLYAIIKNNKYSRKKLHLPLQTRVRHRYEMLMKMRQSDYDRFVWLCDLLQIDFSLKPDVEEVISESKAILAAAQSEADHLVQDKILEYAKFLERERETFEKTKAETIEKLERQMTEFGYRKSERWAS